MEYKDYYKVMGVDKNASAGEIKKAYRKLARKYHPDVNQGDKKSEERFKEINEAAEVLNDPDKRAKYDQLGSSWNAYQQGGGHSSFDWNQWATSAGGGSQQVNLDDFSDFFETIFGGIDGNVRSIPRQGQDYHQVVDISLEEAFKGTARLVQLGKRQLKIKIPKGAATGTKVRVRGEGAPGQGGGKKGDLYLEVNVLSHPIFERVDNDLYADLPIDVYTAVLGGEAIVPTFKGKVKLKIPAGAQSGRKFRLKGQGFPLLKQPDERGDLYTKVMIQVPENLSPEEIELFEELADIRGL